MSTYSKEQALTQFQFVETGCYELANKVEQLKTIVGDGPDGEAQTRIKQMLWDIGDVNGWLYRLRYDWEQSQTTNPDWDIPEEPPRH